MARITLYHTERCRYCRLAAELLAKQGLAYEAVDVTDDDAKRDWLVDRTGQRTVPQIFVDGEPIGGYRELAELDRSGELARRLAAPPPAGET